MASCDQTVLQTAEPQKCYHVTRIFEPQTKTDGPCNWPEKSACLLMSKTDSKMCSVLCSV